MLKKIVTYVCISLLFFLTISQNVVAASQPAKNVKEESSSNNRQYVIKYNDFPSTTIHNTREVKLIKRIADFKSDVIEIKSTSNHDQVIKQYKSSKNVISIDQSVEYKPLQEPGNPKKSLQYYHDLLKLPNKWESAKANPVKVAVLDQGVNLLHPDLNDNIIDYYNVTNPGYKPRYEKHGTHVAGIIGAENNSIGGVGVNPYAQLLAVDVFNGGAAPDYQVAEGVQYAVEKGAKVINLSLGSPYESPILKEAIQNALAANVIIVAAAGNEAIDTYSYPASFEGVISVGASDSENALASFSNFGPSVDLVAPGVDVYSTSHDYKGSKPTYEVMSGTSMASPVVAGVASLLLSKNPNLTPYEVEYIVLHTAKDLGEKGYDTKYGYGLVNPEGALQFDSKKIPKDPRVSDSDSKYIARNETFTNGKIDIKATIDSPKKDYWIKFPVEKGQFIQSSLAVPANSDYKLKMLLFENNSNNIIDSIESNDNVLEKAEGFLYEVKDDGVMVLGVSDVNGRESQLPFQLVVSKEPSIKTDSTSPYFVGSFPFQDSSQFYLTGNEKDYDDFQIYLQADQVVTVELSSLVGVDGTITVLNDSQEILHETNVNGIGGHEYVSFFGYRDKPYTIRISRVIKDEADVGSNLPYHISIHAKEVPVDENDEDVHALSMSKPFSSTGYFQQNGDTDEWLVSPEKSMLVHMTISKNEEDRNDPTFQVLEWVPTIEDWLPVADSTEKSHLYLGLKEGEKYKISVSNKFGLPTINPYTFDITPISTELHDPYENNNSISSAVALPDKPFTGSFSLKNDQDSFYLSPAKDMVYGFYIEQTNNVSKTTKLPKEVFTPINPSVVVIEDTNKNRKLDNGEKEKSVEFPNYMLNFISGSFAAKKNGGYFIILKNGESITDHSTLMTYRMHVSPLSQQDEDKNNSTDFSTFSKKAIPLKEKNSTWQTTGYYQAYKTGDTDTYKFVVSKKGTYKISLTHSKEVNGSFKLYNKTGSLLSESNEYPTGDSEVSFHHLSAGTYFIVSKEVDRKASLNPYSLKIEKTN
ncbi:S8 family serine peptidase [Fredinandcohnia humi]